MLGPSYGEWWNERPASKRFRASIVVFPFIALSLWAFYMRDARVNSEIFSAVERSVIFDMPADFVDLEPFEVVNRLRFPR